MLLITFSYLLYQLYIEMVGGRMRVKGSSSSASVLSIDQQQPTTNNNGVGHGGRVSRGGGAPKGPTKLNKRQAMRAKLYELVAKRAPIITRCIEKYREKRRQQLAVTASSSTRDKKNIIGWGLLCWRSSDHHNKQIEDLRDQMATEDTPETTKPTEQTAPQQHPSSSSFCQQQQEIAERKETDSSPCSLGGGGAPHHVDSTRAPEGSLDSTVSPHKIPHIDGAPNDGAPHDGAPSDGAPRDGALHDGVPHDGVPHDGVLHDEDIRDGATHDGAPHDGAPHVGALNDGDTRDGATHDEAPSRVPPPEERLVSLDGLPPYRAEKLLEAGGVADVARVFLGLVEGFFGEVLLDEDTNPIS